MDRAAAARFLGIAQDAPPSAVKAAHRALMRTVHPDKHGGDEAAGRMAALANEAKELLLAPRPAEPPRGDGPSPPPRGPVSPDEAWSGSSRGDQYTDGFTAPPQSRSAIHPYTRSCLCVASFLYGGLFILAYARTIGGWSGLVLLVPGLAIQSGLGLDAGAAAPLAALAMWFFARIYGWIAYWVFRFFVSAVPSHLGNIDDLLDERVRSWQVGAAAAVVSLATFLVLMGVALAPDFATF